MYVNIQDHLQANLLLVPKFSQERKYVLFSLHDFLQILMQAVARFMGKVRGGRVTFDPARIVMAGGATGACELITCCLADPGDAFLVPTPYYPA